MDIETKYKIEFGKQVARYLKKSGLDVKDFARLIKSNTDNVEDIITGKVGLTIGKMISIANLFGQIYYNFANPNYTIAETSKLRENIAEVIARRKAIGNKTIDNKRLLANALDRLISTGSLNSPTTSKIIHKKMGEDFVRRNPSEITSLLNNSPRNRHVISIGNFNRQNIYIHIDYANKYQYLSKYELYRLISKEENKVNLNENN